MLKWLIIIVLIAAGGAVLFLYPMQREATDLAARARIYCTDEHVAAVEVSRSVGVIKVTSALLGGGSDYYPEDGSQPIECPIVGPDSVSAACLAFQNVADWVRVCGDQGNTPSHEQAEYIAFGFIQDFIKVAPPEPDEDATERIMDVLSVRARNEIVRETVSADMARFIGVQDVPDQGASVEDLQITSDTGAYLTVGLNYSGGRIERNVHLVVENGAWKVDRVSIPDESAAQFEAEGNLVRNNPGLEPNAWHLVYEQPGKPALTMRLNFASSSICAVGNENAACDPEDLRPGARVHVLGEYENEVSVRVIRLETR